MKFAPCLAAFAVSSGDRLRNVVNDGDRAVSRQMLDHRGEFDDVGGRFRRDWTPDGDCRTRMHLVCDEQRPVDHADATRGRSR